MKDAGRILPISRAPNLDLGEVIVAEQIAMGVGVYRSKTSVITHFVHPTLGHVALKTLNESGAQSEISERRRVCNYRFHLEGFSSSVFLPAV